MKKLLRSLLLAAVLCTALCVGALAADGDPTVDGIYNVKVEAAADTLTPQDASGTAVSATNEGGAYSAFYKGAVKLSVDVSGLENGEQYLLLIVKDGTGSAPTGDSIYYIAQAAATAGTVAFTAYPKTMSSGSYTVYLTGGGRTISSGAKVGSFDYYQAYTLGDVNGDDTINVLDAMDVIYHIVGSKTLSETQKLAANVVRGGSDDAINVKDAMQIIYYIVGTITSFD